jgi:glycosyltransferase involved in cell wall biosynthesis
MIPKSGDRFSEKIMPKQKAMADGTPLKILHVLRAPVGGLFRHVLDLAQGQAAHGHRVGIVAGESAAGSSADARLDALAGQLALGVSRIPIQRQVGLGDAAAVRHVTRVVAEAGPDVVHGHGAKGGAFARLAAGSGIRVYTPHGGSLHYGRWTPQGLVYRVAERILMRRTDLLLFESDFARKTYQASIGAPGMARVVHNGVGAAEFEPVAPNSGASDIITIGELRYLKGIDVLIEAVSELSRQGRKLTATIVGEGPDAHSLQQLVAQHDLADAIRLAGYHPARQAFALGRVLVVPSRAESLPYIVLEAAAAGVPMIATRVGGIPEIFETEPLVPPGDASALARAIAAALDDLPAAQAAAQQLRGRVRTLFSQDAMVAGILAAYQEAIAAKFHRSH